MADVHECRVFCDTKRNGMHLIAKCNECKNLIYLLNGSVFDKLEIRDIETNKLISTTKMNGVT